MRNKDTLLKEADEYVNSIYELARNQNGMYTQVQVKQAYIAGKKSMQKENAELKNLIKSEHEIEARKNNKLISQLTEAKEIIREFITWGDGLEEYDPENPEKHTKAWNKLFDKAEAFIKE